MERSVSINGILLNLEYFAQFYADDGLLIDSFKQLIGDMLSEPNNNWC